jgi:hypothetical protein
MAGNLQAVLITTERRRDPARARETDRKFKAGKISEDLKQVGEERASGCHSLKAKGRKSARQAACFFRSWSCFKLEKRDEAQSK